MKNIYDLTYEEMEEYFLNIGSKKFHAMQLFTWLYEKRVESYSEVTNIKKELLDNISRDYSIDRLKIVSVEEDVDVSKYLFEFFCLFIFAENIYLILTKTKYFSNNFSKYYFFNHLYFQYFPIQYIYEQNYCKNIVNFMPYNFFCRIVFVWFIFKISAKI